MNRKSHSSDENENYPNRLKKNFWVGMGMGSYLFVIYCFVRLLNFVFVGSYSNPVKTPTKSGEPPIVDVLNFHEQKVSVQETYASPVFHNYNGGRFAVITPPTNTGSSNKNVLNTAQHKAPDSAISSYRYSLNFKRNLLAFRDFRRANARAVTGYRIVQVRGFAVFASINVTGREHLLSPPARLPHLEKHVNQFVQIINKDSRLKSLQKTLNIQGWQESAVDEPIIIFNAESTYGLYRHNHNMVKVVKSLIINYLNENPDLKFSFDLKGSQADHIQERNVIEAFGLGKKDTATYLLRADIHLAKTYGLDLARPDTITDIPEWFLNNGTKTIDFLETLWVDGKLTNTVECFDQYRDAINACTKMDIAVFHETGLDNVDMIHHSSIRAARQGTRDAMRLGRLIGYAEKKDLNVPRALDFVRGFAEKAKTTAALLHHAELIAQVNGNPTGITSQSFEKETFRNSFKITNRLAAKIMPILQSDVQYQADLKDVLDILDGGGGYVDHLSTETYLSVMRSLQDPKRKFFIVPSQATVQDKK